MEVLFRNKVLIRTSLSSPFFLIPVALPTPHPPSKFNIIDLQILCCKLSKTYRLACFLYAEFIFVIFKRIQSDSAAQAVEEIIRLFPTVNVRVRAEEEVKSASLTAKAIEWGLRFVMFDNGWSSIGDNLFVQSTFACSEERKHLCAINVRVQAEPNEGIVFLVSPDVIWFKRHKISEFASSGNSENFENGSIVNLDVHPIPVNCTVLPSLHKGHVIGISKVLPERETLNRSEELLTLKNGISLSSSYFLNIQFNNRGHIMEWYPSAFVMHGSGLSPAPHSIRTTNAMHVLNLFIHLIEGWDFFSQGPLKVKEVSSLGTSTMTPVWMTATSTLNSFTARDNIPCDVRTNNGKNDILSYHNLTLDYHMPKPPSGCISASNEKEPNALKIIAPSDKMAFDVKSKSTHDADIIRPIFVKRGLKSKTKCEIASSGTEIKLKSKNGFLSEVAAKESGIVSARKVAEKRNFSDINVKIKATKENRNAGSGNIVGNETVQKSTSSEAILNESTAENTEITVTITMHDKVSVEDWTCNVTTTKANLATESNMAEIMHTSSESCVDKPGVCKPKVEECVQSNRASGNKEEVEASMQIQSSVDSKIVKPAEVLATKTSTNGRKSEETISGACKKMKSKPSVDIADIVAKVLDCHNRGVLQSLTIPELKSFLATRKAKVGGKKEELIQRVNTILSVVQREVELAENQ